MMLKVVVCVKEQLVINLLRMIHLDLHLSRVERVSAVARMVTGLASVKVVKVIHLRLSAAEAECCGSSLLSDICSDCSYLPPHHI